MGFPILRLPFVALKVALDYMNNIDLVTVSLLSKRTDWFLRACGKKNVSFFNLPESKIRGLSKFRILQLFLSESRRQGELPDWNFNLRCSVSYELHIEIRCIHFCIRIYIKAFDEMKHFPGIRKNLKIGKSSVPIVVTKGYVGLESIRAFFNSKTDGMILFIDYFRNNSYLSIEKLELAERNPEAIRTVVNHMSSTQSVARNVETYPSLSAKDFKLILRNVSATEKFSSFMSLSRKFEFNGTIRAKNIFIKNGDWFTIQNVLTSTESEAIHVEGSNYTKEELRRFLEEWKAGKLPKLKEVILATRISANKVIEGFERWEGTCRKSGGWPKCVMIKGHGDSHGCVHTDGYTYRMLIHDN